MGARKLEPLPHEDPPNIVWSWIKRRNKREEEEEEKKEKGQEEKEEDDPHPRSTENLNPQLIKQATYILCISCYRKYFCRLAYMEIRIVFFKVPKNT